MDAPLEISVTLVGVDEERGRVVLDGDATHGEKVWVRERVHGHALLQQQRHLHLRRVVGDRFHHHLLLLERVRVRVRTKVHAAKGALLHHALQTHSTSANTQSHTISKNVTLLEYQTLSFLETDNKNGQVNTFLKTKFYFITTITPFRVCKLYK